MDAETILAIAVLAFFILLALGLGAKGKDIIMFFFATCILFPLSIITLPLWGTIWLIGKILDIDSFVKVGETCSIPLRAFSGDEHPPI